MGAVKNHLKFLLGTSEPAALGLIYWSMKLQVM